MDVLTFDGVRASLIPLYVLYEFAGRWCVSYSALVLKLNEAPLDSNQVQAVALYSAIR